MENQANIHFTIDFDGKWYGTDGKEVNEASLYFLSRNIRRDNEGYFVALGFGPVKLVVEDVPFIIREIKLSEGRGERFIEMTVSGDSKERLNPETLMKRGGYYYCMVREGNIPARFGEDAAKELEKYLTVEGDDIYLSL